MSELRWHPLLQEWVITATHRQERTFHPPPEYCPLCPTRDDAYPTEVPEPTYEIVVFENRFPSLVREPPAPAVAPTPFSPVMPAQGVCEVVLYTPDHHATLADLPLERIEQLIYVWRDRYAELGARPEVQYVFIFENKGREIGVTLSHPHGQIYAYPFLPPKLERELDAMRRHYAATGGNLLLEILQYEVQDGRRVVQRMDGWVSFVPFFARYPYEVYLVPESAPPRPAGLDRRRHHGAGADSQRHPATLRPPVGLLDALHHGAAPAPDGRRAAPLLAVPHRVLPALPHARQVEVLGRLRVGRGGVHQRHPARRDGTSVTGD
jgi:UDPglucose--hexose-1-phosphate uridylyltransferase